MSSIPQYHHDHDEHLWVSHICRILEEELDDDDYDGNYVSIFNVPKSLKEISPDSYTPQQVAIGPYHFQRPELREMERYKLSAAKRTQRNHFQNNLKFHDIVHQFTIIHASRIRACYYNYLDLSCERLAWMMALDSSFLLEFLHLYAEFEGKSIIRASSRAILPMMAHLQRQNTSHNAIIKDIIMLENQIPLFVLRKVLEFQFKTLEETDDWFSSMLLGFCRELSPLKIVKNIKPQSNLVLACSHLLDFFYKMVTCQYIGLLMRDENVLEIVDECQCEDSQRLNNEDTRASRIFFKQLPCIMLGIFRAIDGLIKNFIKRIFVKNYINLFSKVPLRILSHFPMIGIFVNLVPILLSCENVEMYTVDDKPPLMEEIAIPSVIDLSKSNVRFHPSNGDLSTLSFDTKTITFYLPTINLDTNTEAIMRNLVAYEASIASGPLVFTRYTELMNGMIDTEEDVKLLREKGIIINRLKSDKEAADLWNGMSKSIRLTRVPFLDKVIEDVNKYHEGKWKVRFRKFMRRHRFGSSWKFIVLFVVVWMLLLLGFRAFFTVLTCPRYAG